MINLFYRLPFRISEWRLQVETFWADCVVFSIKPSQVMKIGQWSDWARFHRSQIPLYCKIESIKIHFLILAQQCVNFQGSTYLKKKEKKSTTSHVYSHFFELFCLLDLTLGLSYCHVDFSQISFSFGASCSSCHWRWTKINHRTGRDCCCRLFWALRSWESSSPSIIFSISSLLQ